MDDKLLTTEEVAAYFRTVPATVRHWRYAGTGPKALKVGKRVLYREADVMTWALAKSA